MGLGLGIGVRNGVEVRGQGSWLGVSVRVRGQGSWLGVRGQAAAFVL